MKLSSELSEGRVENRFAQLGFRKSFVLQILNANALVLTNEFSREFMQEVLTQVRSSRMSAGHDPFGFRSSITSSLAAGQSPLRSAQLTLLTPKELWSRNAFAITEDGEMFQPKVYPNVPKD